MKTIKLFWTGGYDSTYRLIELSFCDVEIKPYYLGNNRRSQPLELSAIRKIRELVLADSSCRAQIEEPVIVPYNDRPCYDDISSALGRLRETDYIGGQYEWLASFARDNPGIELCIHKDDKAILLIEKYGVLSPLHDDITGGSYTIDKSASSKDIVTLFENFSLPLSKHTKRDMKIDYIKWGYKDLMDMTWFCHSPKRGKPCGHCNPCVYTVQEGMAERLPPAARVRYTLRHLYLFMYKVKIFLLPKKRK